ncbi:cytochrome P450 4V2-like [Dendronephthya gigantea]|uniref:cytochrome P450 4V2-like n=1 Tax=Dendronephthya gigantea TaxID=151771 RepID=UPI00106D61F7|nr:cytochrome P450 4V2-like [Dendronephthya gigantea]
MDKRLWKHIQFCNEVWLIPVPVKTSPIFGHALTLKRDPHELFTQTKGWVDKCYADGLFSVWLGRTPVVVLFKPEYVEILLASQKNITKTPLYIFLHSWLGTGLLTSTGNKWKSRRRLLTPTFHFKILNDFVSIHQKQSAILVELLQEKADKGEFDIAPYITLCVLDIICETSMGIDIKAQYGSNPEYTKAVFSTCELIQERQKSPWLWPDFIYNITSSGRSYQKALSVLHGFTNQVINDRIEQRKLRKSENFDGSDDRAIYSSSNRRIRAFLDLLLEEYDQGNITKEGVREEVDTFMFEGHDTTAASLQWIIHLLSINPDVQSRLQQEVDNWYGKFCYFFLLDVSDKTLLQCLPKNIQSQPRTQGFITYAPWVRESLPPDGKIKPEQLKDLSYLECVVKEGLRLFPSVPLFGRELTEECKFGPYRVPEGCSIIVALMGLHRNPEVWENPETFNPDRFLSENNVGRHPFAYVPFSAGPRNCIGQRFAMMEDKIVLASIIRHFNIKSTQSSDDIRKSAEIILKSTSGIMVELETRIF